MVPALITVVVLKLVLGAFYQREAGLQGREDVVGAHDSGDYQGLLAVDLLFGRAYEDAAGLVGVAGLYADYAGSAQQEVDVPDPIGYGDAVGGGFARLSLRAPGSA